MTASNGDNMRFPPQDDWDRTALLSLGALVFVEVCTCVLFVREFRLQTSWDFEQLADLLFLLLAVLYLPSIWFSARRELRKLRQVLVFDASAVAVSDRDAALRKSMSYFARESITLLMLLMPVFLRR